MTSVDDHAAHIRDLTADVFLSVCDEHESLPLADALGRVTATEVLSPLDLPLFRNSQMDGFAVRAADLTNVPVMLPVVADQPAGAPPGPGLEPGTAVRIMTGAVVPEGADCVVPVEQTTFAPGHNGAVAGGRVTIRQARGAGDFVRERGSDLTAGSRLVPGGLRLAPRHLAALAAAGIQTVAVRRRPRLAVITTGAELVLALPADPDSPLTPTNAPAPGLIFDANLIALITAVRETGCEVVLAEATSDVPANLAALLDRARGARADLIITSGGISQGAFEVVRELLEPLGALVTTITMQPGGPQSTGHYDGVPVISFPGNPVSTQVSFVVFLRPILRALTGLPPLAAAELPLASPVSSVPGKRQFLRGRYVDVASQSGLPERRVEVVSGPSSHLVAAMAAADVLIDIPLEDTQLDAGRDVRVWEL